jgi:hypothetical protein
MIAKIVAGWPRRLASKRARAMGFRSDASMDAIIQAFIEDDLPAAKRRRADSPRGDARAVPLVPRAAGSTLRATQPSMPCVNRPCITRVTGGLPRWWR